MRIFIVTENAQEVPLAENLVRVLKSIGKMLLYGKVTGTGVMLEDWKSKPNIRIDVQAVNAGALIPPGASITKGEPISYNYELAYRDNYGYSGDRVTVQQTPGEFAMTREWARNMVRMFPEKMKALEAKPDTTGVTIRQLDIESEDDADTTDQ